MSDDFDGTADEQGPAVDEEAEEDEDDDDAIDDVHALIFFFSIRLFTDYWVCLSVVLVFVVVVISVVFNTTLPLPF